MKRYVVRYVSGNIRDVEESATPLPESWTGIVWEVYRLDYKTELPAGSKVPRIKEPLELERRGKLKINLDNVEDVLDAEEETTGNS